jgi:hypothetical protein
MCKIGEVDNMKPLSASSTKGTKGLSFKWCRFPSIDESILCGRVLSNTKNFFLNSKVLYGLLMLICVQDVCSF